VQGSHMWVDVESAHNSSLLLPGREHAVQPHLQLSDQPRQLAGCQEALKRIRRPCKHDQHNVTDFSRRMTIVMQATQDTSRTTAGRLQLSGSSTWAVHA
jgi:hypothetical protein